MLPWSLWEGESLREVLNHFGRIPLRKALDVTLQLCAGLRGGARARHRASPPEARKRDDRFAGQRKDLESWHRALCVGSATRLTGHKAGIPAYTAPEQVSGGPADFRADIYLLGLLLYEVFTGKQAAAAENRGDTALEQMPGMPVPPHEIEPTIPVSVERAILKCLETEPANRFQSIMELETSLPPPEPALFWLRRMGRHRHWRTGKRSPGRQRQRRLRLPQRAGLEAQVACRLDCVGSMYPHRDRHGNALDGGFADRTESTAAVPLGAPHSARIRWG